MDTEALVVGAGPAGLVTAAELARRGVACRIVDQLPAPRPGTRCPTVWQRTLEVLDLMGLPVEDYLRQGVTLEAKVFHIGDEVASISVRDDSSPWPLPLLVRQVHTERLLGQHLRRLGVRIERPVRATLLAHDASGVTVALRRPDGEERVRAAWLVLAHGDPADPSDVPEPPDQAWLGGDGGPPGIGWRQRELAGVQWLQVDARLRCALALGRHQEHIFRDDSSHLGLVPLPGGAHRLFMTLSDQAAGGHRAPGALAAAASAAIGVAVEVAQLGPVWRVRPRSRLADSFRAGRCLLAGESAKRFPLPVHGMNSAIHDAFNLAWKLAAVIRGHARPELLDSYTAERRAAARVVLERAERVLGHGTSSPVSVLRERLRRGVFDIRTEPATDYHDSPLSADHGGARCLRPGERVPAWSVVAGGRAGDLFGLLRGSTGWTLLLLEPAASSEAPAPATRAASAAPATAARRDLEAALARWGGRVTIRAAAVSRNAGDLDGQVLLCLVRPDGRVGFRGTLAHLEALRDYLHAILG